MRRHDRRSDADFGGSQCKQLDIIEHIIAGLEESLVDGVDVRRISVVAHSIGIPTKHDITKWIPLLPPRRDVGTLRGVGVGKKGTNADQAVNVEFR